MAAHRYWRICFIRAQSTGQMTLAQVQLRTSDNTNHATGGTASASNSNASYPASNATDGNTSTEWNGTPANTSGSSGWWQYDFGAANAWDIASVVIQGASSTSGNQVYAPTGWTLAYSDNGTTWQDACAEFTASAWTAGSSQTFTVGSPIGTAWTGMDALLVALTNNNLTATAYGQTTTPGDRSLYRSSGKYYFEGTVSTAVGASTGLGISNPSATYAGLSGNGTNGFQTYQGFAPYYNGGSASGMGTFGAVPQGTTVAFAVDLGANLLWVRQGAAGNWNGTAGNNPATGTGGFSISAIAGAGLAPTCLVAQTNDAITLNTGASAFVGAIPSGFSAWMQPLVVASPQARAMVMA